MTKLERILQQQKEAEERQKKERKTLDTTKKQAEKVITKEWNDFITKLWEEFDCVRDGKIQGNGEYENQFNIITNDYTIRFFPRFNDGSGYARLVVADNLRTVYNARENYPEKEKAEDGRWYPVGKVVFPMTCPSDLENVIYFIQNKNEIFARVEDELYLHIQKDMEKKASKMAAEREKVARLAGSVATMNLSVQEPAPTPIMDRKTYEIIMKQADDRLMTALENQIQEDMGGTRQQANIVVCHILDILDAHKQFKESTN